jgi:hypothetical protein
VVQVEVLAVLGLMGLLRLPMVDFPAVLLTTAVLLVQTLWAVVAVVGKALLQFLAHREVLSGAAVLAVEVGKPGQLAIVAAADQSLAAVVVVVGEILLRLLEEALEEDLRSTRLTLL